MVDFPFKSEQLGPGEIIRLNDSHFGILEEVFGAENWTGVECQSSTISSCRTER